MGHKSQLLISEEESLTESVQKYLCLYDKSCADYKKKSLLKMRGLQLIKKWTLKSVRSFLISYEEWNLNEEIARYFTNALVLSDCKSLPTIKNMHFIIKTCRSTKPSNVFITVTLKLENSMRSFGVPYHLFLNKCVIRI